MQSIIYKYEIREQNYDDQSLSFLYIYYCLAFHIYAKLFLTRHIKLLRTYKSSCKATE